MVKDCYVLFLSVAGHSSAPLRSHSAQFAMDNNQPPFVKYLQLHKTGAHTVPVCK